MNKSRKIIIKNKTTMTNSKSGLGVGGKARKGQPKTDAQRKKDHQKKHPGTKLPPRGSGLKK